MTLKNPITLRLPLGPMAAQAVQRPLAVANPISVDELTLSSSPNEKEVRAYLASIRNVLDGEMERMRGVARAQAGRQVSISPELPTAITEKLAAVPGAYAETMLKAATDGNAMFRGLLVQSLASRTDYDDSAKGVFLKYLPKLPDLIVAIAAKNWFEGVDAAIAAGWKEEKKDEHGGVLRERGFRYSIIAARHSVTDALVVIAKLNQRAGVDRFARCVLGEADEVLKTLVPSGVSKAELADFVVQKQKNSFSIRKRRSTKSRRDRAVRVRKITVLRQT